MKIKMILIALTALLSLASCGDDDSGIQLTQDEIIGDINTGKKNCDYLSYHLYGK